MSQNEEPDENAEFGGFSFMQGVPFPIPTEAIEAARRRQDHNIMRAQAAEIERRQFLESLDASQLIAVRSMIQLVAAQPGAADYLQGWINSMIQYVHKKCAACGGDHVEEMFDHEIVDESVPESQEEVDEETAEDEEKSLPPREDWSDQSKDIEAWTEAKKADGPKNLLNTEALEKQVLLEKEMEYWNVRPALGGNGVNCRGCGKWYQSFEDRKLREDCPECVHNTKWGGSNPNA